MNAYTEAKHILTTAVALVNDEPNAAFQVQGLLDCASSMYRAGFKGLALTLIGVTHAVEDGHLGEARGLLRIATREMTNLVANAHHLGQ